MDENYFVGPALTPYLSLLFTSGASAGFIPCLTGSFAGGVAHCDGPGFDPGKIDGVLGHGVRAAVRLYQKAHNIPADGFPTMAVLSRVPAAPNVDSYLVVSSTKGASNS